MPLYSHDRSFRSTRGVLTFTEVIGYFVLILGLAAAAIGFASGGFSEMFGVRPTIALRFIAMLPGLGISYLALWSIADIKHKKVSVEMAEMTLEMLKLERNKAEYDIGAEIDISGDLSKTEPEFRSTGHQDIGTIPAKVSVIGNWEHRGQTVVSYDNGTFALKTPLNWKAFRTFEEVDDYISNL
jgi:hypothetical protein